MDACAHHTFGEIGLLGVKDGGQDRRAYHVFIGSERPDETFAEFSARLGDESLKNVAEIDDD